MRSDGAVLATVEVGGSGVQTVLLAADAEVVAVREGARPDADLPVALAVPGEVVAGRVVEAVNLGWTDVDPAEALGLDTRPVAVVNDAEAAAVGESRLRPGCPDLVLVGLGTGVGGAVVRGGTVASGRFGHEGRHSASRCRCGRIGCLETVAAGWALPVTVTGRDLDVAAAAIATQVADARGESLVVVAGGLARRHPAIVDRIAAHLAPRPVEPSAAPQGLKSAAPFGLFAIVVAPPSSPSAPGALS